MQQSKKQRTRFLFALALLASSWGCASTRPPLQTAEPLQSRAGSAAALSGLSGAINAIVLDPGHGGHDPGTSHFGLKEKSLVLDIARRLRDSLQTVGLSVAMTRDSDQFISLNRRPEIANGLQADLFVSVHVNANPNSHRISGVEVYYPRESVVSSTAEWPPFIASGEVGIPSLTVKQVAWDLVLVRTRSQSRRLASAICHSMHTALQVPCRAVKPARFVVLREAWMPAVLVEVGYVTNQAEASRLGTEAYRQAIAQAIADGVVAYVRGLGAQHI